MANVRNILVNEADYNRVRENLKTFLNDDPASPFYRKNYNFNSGALAGILDVSTYLIHYLSYTLNKTIEEIFIDTATLSESIYSLIKNYNYTPQLRKPATSFMKVKYFRNTNHTLLMNDVSGYVVGETISQFTATAEIMHIDTVNRYLYLTNVSVPITSGTISGPGGSGTRTILGWYGDLNSSDDDSFFEMTFNKVKYTDDYFAIPTFRDSIQEDYYDDALVTDFQDKNIITFSISPWIDPDTGYRYLQTIVPVYQADWYGIEQTIDAGFSASPKIKLQNTSTLESFEDKVIIDSIRVFVQEGGSGDWIEYEDIKTGLVNQNQTTFDGGRLYKLEYVNNDSVYITFNIDYITRTLQIGDNVRVYFAYTEGNDINTVSGNSEFVNSDFESISINDVTDVSVSNPIFDSTNYGSTVSIGVADMLYSSLIAENNTDSALNTFDNGSGRQSDESIKESAPLYYSGQGRIVTEEDWNIYFKSHFSEFYDVKCWGGNREFLDVSNIMNDATDWYTATYSNYSNPPTPEELALTLQYAQKNYYQLGELTVNSIDASDISAGKYVRDVGNVYFTMIKPNFQFVDNASTINEVKAFFDKKKILTIFTKYMNPTITFIQPRYTVKINKSYLNTVDVDNLKQRLFDEFSKNVGFNKTIYYADIEDILRNFEEVDYITTKSYTIKAKVNNTDNSSDYIYVRFYTRFTGDLNTTITTSTGTYLLRTSGSKVIINSITIDDSEVNNNFGLLKFKNKNLAGSQFFTDTEFYINNVPLGGNSIAGVKENLVAIESKEDISITLI